MQVLDLNAPEAWVRPGDDYGHLRIYPATPPAVREAREFASETAACMGFVKRVDDVAEVASELATNAIRYGVPRGAVPLFAINCHCTARAFFLDVIDRNPAEKPVAGNPDVDSLQESGMGLLIVANLATEWIPFSLRLADAFVKVVRAAFVA